MKVNKEVLTSKSGAADMVATEIQSGIPWLNWSRFPLVPQFRFRTANEWNTRSFNLYWLCFRLWSMDSVSVGFEVTLDDQQFQARLYLPYLIAGIFMPLFPQSWQQKLWRKPKGMKKLDKA